MLLYPYRAPYMRGVAWAHGAKRGAAMRLAPRGSGSMPARPAAGKGFGSPPPPKPQPRPPADDAAGSKVQAAARLQRGASQLLALLLEAPDPATLAAAHVDQLSPEFFVVCDTYMNMARAEGNAEVAARIEAALKVALEAKQATLRPEIRLLNRLMATPGARERRQVLQQPDSQEALVMSNGYFFDLLATMQRDVAAQTESSRRPGLLEMLGDIQAEAHAARPGAG